MVLDWCMWRLMQSNNTSPNDWTEDKNIITQLNAIKLLIFKEVHLLQQSSANL